MTNENEKSPEQTEKPIMWKVIDKLEPTVNWILTTDKKMKYAILSIFVIIILLFSFSCSNTTNVPDGVPELVTKIFNQKGREVFMATSAADILDSELSFLRNGHSTFKCERVFKVKKIEDDTYDAKAIVSKNRESVLSQRALVSIKYEIIDDMVNVSVDFQTLSIMPE